MRRSILVLVIITLLGSFLRLYRLSEVPVSLFGDELDVGYHAYSILKTGKDYSGNQWPSHFQSLAEWRTPLYLYSAAPTVMLFGISPLGVRLPAALFGILAIPAFYFLLKELTVGEKLKKRQTLISLLGAFLLAISPWHIQYSRAAFEVTEMLFCLFVGIYMLLRTFRTKENLLWVSGISFALMPWIYSTAKLFTPMFLVLLVAIYLKDFLRLPRKTLVYGCIALFVVGAPIAWSTVFGGGTQRFNYISVFSDPTIEPEVGTLRGEDAFSRGETGTGLSPTIVDRLFHNKFTYVGDIVMRNALMPFSTSFLFLNGDPNPRHSIDKMGQFYRLEFAFLVFGLSFFLIPGVTKRKWLIAGWILLSVFPSSLTRDGGDHATRLILLMAPLIFLIAVGIVTLIEQKNILLRSVLIGVVAIGYVFSFAFYQHTFWIHNPYQSERWWHYGWGPAISEMKKIENQFDRVVITSADEPPWIFFAAWSEFDPATWHKGYPFSETDLPGFGKVSYIDKYYFGKPADKMGLYDWGKILDTKTLYIASAKEVNVNLITEPHRTPGDLRLIKSIAYPSGEPAFYLFTHAQVQP